MPRGYRRLPDGTFRAWVRVASKRDDFNEIRTKRFPSTGTPQAIREWRALTREQLKTDLKQRQQRRAEVTGGAAMGFRYDAVQLYLPAVQALPTYEERVRDILLWVEEFRDRDRHTIKAHEIRAVRDRWLTVGPKRKCVKVNGKGQWVDVAEPLAASTVNHRLRALSNLWTVLDGVKAPNPVRDVPEASEPNAIPRAIDYALIRRILAAMADRGYPTKGQPRPTESISKAGVRSMAWAGLEPGEFARLSDDDILAGIAEGALIVPGRRKGDGAPDRIVPLNEDAVAALQDFVRLRQGGARFSSRAALRAWQRACVKVLGRTLRLKDLRHSFVTAIVMATKDVRLAGRLAGHTNGRTTDRYALAALLPTLQAGIDAFTTETADKEKP